MRDIPAFTTENGIAGLVLSQVPYSKDAYISIFDSSDEKAFVEECVSFCKAAGADRVYGTGMKDLAGYELFTSVCRMSADLIQMDKTDLCVFPVTEQTVERWRSLYNEKVTSVPAGSVLTAQMAQKMLLDGDCYFVHKNGELWGIGKASGDMIHWISSHRPGAGEQVVKALCSALSAERVNVEVATTNAKAVKLYASLGFITTSHLTDWYILSK